ncbi:hypothetical protein BGZ58_001241, partial [Dissophora ornata]
MRAGGVEVEFRRNKDLGMVYQCPCRHTFTTGCSLARHYIICRNSHNAGGSFEKAVGCGIQKKRKGKAVQRTGSSAPMPAGYTQRRDDGDYNDNDDNDNDDNDDNFSDNGEKQ